MVTDGLDMKNNNNNNVKTVVLFCMGLETADRTTAKTCY